MPPRTRNQSSGSVRIVAGTLRGSRLAVADSDGLRPTSDRVRETLFNWLAPVVAGSRCVDLFAGTGALGLEALSRGAAQCTFVERDSSLVAGLRENVARLHVEGADVVQRDAFDFLAAPHAPCDLVFVDPPFHAEVWGRALQAIESNDWLRDGAFVHVESPRESGFAVPDNWRMHREGHAGSVRFVLYRRVARDPLS